jgi:hypothetical protein
VEDQTGGRGKRSAEEGGHLMPKGIPDIEGLKFSFWSNENDEPTFLISAIEWPGFELNSGANTPSVCRRVW